MGAGFRETTQDMVQYPRASTRREPSPLDLKGTRKRAAWGEPCDSSCDFLEGHRNPR